MTFGEGDFCIERISQFVMMPHTLIKSWNAYKTAKDKKYATCISTGVPSAIDS